ncbi:MAG: hypothetical protein MJK10_03785 [Pseudomonadales bacterium]|nr:hypothetical protein [Pseudomonadales bacterium]NRA15192.1 hypothetical protein [Oceanospirillaceae bacterium]
MLIESDSAELEEWPVEQIGTFLRAGYSYNIGDNRQHSGMPGSPPVSRLMSSQLIMDHEATLLLTPAQLQIFEQWWYSNINQGDSWFNIELKTGAGLNTVPAKFAQNGKGRAVMDGNYYRLKCHLITSDLPAATLTEDQSTQLLQTNIHNFQLGTDGLREVVHGEW